MMTLKRQMGYLIAACALLACSQARSPLTEEQAAALRAPALPALEEPTAAMLDAALSGDPEKMRQAIANTANCHAAATCPGFGACTGWSSLSDCGDTCTKPCCHDRACNEPDFAGTIYFERYRVCFNPAGASCTEWSVTHRTLCGC